MTIVNVEAAFTRKIDDGKYGNATFHASMTASLDDDEDAEAVYADLYERCKKLVYERAKPKEKPKGDEKNA